MKNIFSPLFQLPSVSHYKRAADQFHLESCSWDRYSGWSRPKGMKRCWYLPCCLHSLLQWSHPRVHGLSPHSFSPHWWQFLVIKNFLTSLLWLSATRSANTNFLQIQQEVFISTIPSVENLRIEGYSQVTEICNKIVIIKSFDTDPKTY